MNVIHDQLIILIITPVDCEENKVALGKFAYAIL